MNSDSRRLVQASSLLRKRVQYDDDDDSSYSSSLNSISTESEEEDGYGGGSSNTISNKGLNNGMMLGATHQKEKIVFIKNGFVWANNTNFIENSTLVNTEYSWVIKKDAKREDKDKEMSYIRFNDDEYVINLSGIEKSGDGEEYYLIYKIPEGTLKNKRNVLDYHNYYHHDWNEKESDTRHILKFKLPTANKTSFTLEEKKDNKFIYITFTYDEHGRLTVVFTYRKVKDLVAFRWEYIRMNWATSNLPVLKERWKYEKINNPRTIDFESIYRDSDKQLLSVTEFGLFSRNLKKIKDPKINVYEFEKDGKSNFKQKWRDELALREFSLIIPYIGKHYFSLEIALQSVSTQLKPLSSYLGFKFEHDIVEEIVLEGIYYKTNDFQCYSITIELEVLRDLGEKWVSSYNKNDVLERTIFEKNPSRYNFKRIIVNKERSCL